MFQKNTVLQLISVHVDVGQRSGHRWDLRIGFWKKPTTGRLFTHHSAIGNSRVNHTIGSLRAGLYGLPNGRLNKLLQDAVPKKSGGEYTMIILIVDGVGCFAISGVG